MASLRKGSNKYVDRFTRVTSDGDRQKLSRDSPHTKLHHSVDDTTSSLQYSIRDIERLDRKGDWKFNCSYNQAMEQENIVLQVEESPKQVTEDEIDKIEAKDQAPDKTVRLEYLDVVNNKERDGNKDMANKGPNDVCRKHASNPPPKSGKYSRSNTTTEPLLSVRRQISYIHAVGRDDSFRHDMEERSDDNDVTAVADFTDLEAVQENSNEEPGLNKNGELGEKREKWNMNSSYKHALGKQDSNARDDNHHLSGEFGTPGATSELGGSMTSEEDKISLNSESECDNARMTSYEEARMNFEDNSSCYTDQVKPNQTLDSQRRPGTFNQEMSTDVSESDESQYSYRSDSSGVSTIPVGFGNDKDLMKEPNNRQQDTRQSKVESSKNEDFVSVIKCGKTETKSWKKFDEENFGKVPDSSENKEDDLSEKQNEIKENGEPCVVELTAKKDKNNSVNETGCNDKFKRFLSHLHLAEVSSISEILHDDSPRKQKPVPSPRRSKMKVGEQVSREHNDFSRQSEIDKTNSRTKERELSPYDNVPTQESDATAASIEVTSDISRESSVFTSTRSDTPTQKYTKINPVLARFLKKPPPPLKPSSPMNNSPLNRSLPGLQENDSSVLVEDDYTPEPSLPILTTSSILPQPDGSVISNNIVLEGSLSFLKNSVASEIEGSLSFLKNSVASESTNVGSDGTLRNNSTSENETNDTSLKCNNNKVFSSPAKYSFLDQDLLKASPSHEAGNKEDNESSSEVS